VSNVDATLYEALSLPVNVAGCTKPVVTVPEDDGDTDGDGDTEGDEDGDDEGVADGADEGADDGADDGELPGDEAPRWPVTTWPGGIVTAGTWTVTRLPTAGSTVFGAGDA
jgi:hypothetical protein